MKKYSSSYQHKVIDRLNKSGNLTDTQKLFWDLGVTIGNITKYFGLKIDFIVDKQSGVINIAHKVGEQNSNFSLINIAGEVKTQIQKLGIQLSNHSDNQELFLGLQVSNENYNKQKSGIGIQSTNKGKKQILNFGRIQYSKQLNGGGQTSKGLSIQITKIILGNQYGSNGLQIADTIVGNQELKKGVQYGKYVVINQKVGKGLSIK